MSIINRTLGSGYATAAEVRAVSGLTDPNDIGDVDLNERILSATLEFINDVVVRVTREVASADATKKVFTLANGLLADLDADGDVDAADLTVRFEKEDTDGQILTAATGTVAIQNAEVGVFTTQNALPDGYKCVVDYGFYRRPLEYALAQRAVRHLAAHLAIVRVKAPGRLTRADTTSIGQDAAALRVHRAKHLDEYRRIVARLLGATIV